MKRLTLVLTLLVTMVTTAMAQINYGKGLWTFPATNHEVVNEVPAEIFADFKEQYKVEIKDEETGEVTSTTYTELTNEKVGVYVTRVRVASAGNVTATFVYNGGNKRMDIGGVDLVNANGEVVYSDYHFGFAGGQLVNNVYTLESVAVGDYTMRFFVTAQKEDITSATSNDSSGNLTIAGAWMYPNEGVYYNIKNVRSNKYVTFKGEGKQFTQESANNGAGSYWYFVEASLDDVKKWEKPWLVDDAIPAGYKPYWVYSAACEKAVENVTNGYMSSPDMTETYPGKIYYIGVHTKDSKTGLIFRPCHEDGSSWNDQGGSGTALGHYTSDDPGSLWSIELANVTVDNLIAMGTTARDNALATVTTYEQAYYFNPTTAQINAVRTAINNIDCSTKEKALTSVITGAAATEEAKITSCTVAPKAGDRFMMKNRGRSGNNYLRAYAAEGDVKCSDFANDLNALDLVWTLVASDSEGFFKLYNERHEVYVGALSTSNNTKMQYTSNAASAGLYEISQTATYTLFHAKDQDATGYLHQSNWGGKEIVRWDNGDCSQWQLIEAPIELTTDLEAPICYAIKSGRDGNYYFTLENNKIKLVNNADIVGNDNAKWFFMLDGDKNLKIYPYADKGNTMGYITVADGNTKLTNDHDAEGYAADTYNLYYNTNNAADNNGKCFAFRPTEGNTFVSNHGGTGNYMGFYNNHNDKGTRIGFENINDAVIKNKIAAWEPYFAHEGDKVCQYIIADEIKTAVNEAPNVIATKSSTDAAYKEIVTALKAPFPEINKPEPGSYYRIGRNDNGTMKYVQGVGSEVKKDNMNTLLISDTKDAVSIFYYGDDKLLSYTAGTYVNENGNSARGLMNIGVEGGTVTFEDGNSIGTIAVKAPSYMHANTSNGIEFIDHCSSAGGHTAHDFIIEEVTELPVNITTAGYASFYAPVAVKATGVKAYTVAINGEWATLTEIEDGVIPANTGVVLEAEEGPHNLAITTTEATATSALEGTVAATYITGDAYVLANSSNGVGLYLATLNQEGKFKNNSHKAYLPATPTMQQSAGFRFRFDGGVTTEIEEVESINENVEIYDLTGRKLQGISGAGIYIINGKKVIVR